MKGMALNHPSYPEFCGGLRDRTVIGALPIAIKGLTTAASPGLAVETSPERSCSRRPEGGNSRSLHLLRSDSLHKSEERAGRSYLTGTGCSLAKSSSDRFASASVSGNRTITSCRPSWPHSPSDDHFCGSGPRGPSIQTRYHSVMSASEEMEFAIVAPCRRSVSRTEKNLVAGTGFEPVTFRL
jgi:hypothetical protein